jgi:NAD(P)-dependent dehydrogenase (short-subunit alcohol dehydrogenase family)
VDHETVKSLFLDPFVTAAYKPKELDNFFKDLNGQKSEKWAFVNCSYPRSNNWGKMNFEEKTMEERNKNVQLHLGSAFQFTQKSVLFLKEQKGGIIVNFGSIYGLVGPDLGIYEGTKMKNSVAYAAIKSGITGFTRYVATTYGEFNIRANVVCPGGVEDRQPESFIKHYNKRTPLVPHGHT